MSINESIIKELTDITTQFFEKTLSSPIKSKEQKDALSSPGEIVASIELAGELKGKLNIQCSQDMACSIASKVISKEVTDYSDGGEDGLRSMLRIIADGLKARSVGEKEFTIGEFSSVSASSLDLSSCEANDFCVLNFEIESGAFDIVLVHGEVKIQASGEEQAQETPVSEESAPETEEASTEAQPSEEQPAEEQASEDSEKSEESADTAAQESDTPAAEETQSEETTSEEPPAEESEEAAVAEEPAAGEHAILEELDKSAQEEGDETATEEAGAAEAEESQEAAEEPSPETESAPEPETSQEETSEELISDAMQKLDDLLSKMKEEEPAE